MFQRLKCRIGTEDFRKDLILFSVLFVLSVIRLWLAAGTPVYIVHAVQDDHLQLSQAFSLYQMDGWLGEYSENMLTKGIAFPLFLFFVCLSRIPYTVAVTLFWIISAGFTVLSVKGLVRNRALLGLIYAALIFSPVTSSMTLFQRIYRNSVAGPSALFLAASCIYLFLHLEKSKARSVVVSLLLGLDLWFVMNLREDAVWLLPLLLAASAATIIRLILTHQQKKLIIRAAVLLILPWLILGGGNLTNALINYKVYGVFSRNDRTGGSFAKTADIFLSAECPGDDADERTVWVSKEKYDMLIGESESLTAIAPDLQKGFEKYEPSWNEDGQLNGDFFVWALRDGAARAGYYESAKKAEAFWAKVYSELQEAVDSGRIHKRKALFLSSSSRGLTAQNAKEIPKLVADSTISNALFRAGQCAQHRVESEGGIYYIRRAESLTGTYAVYPDNQIENDPERIIAYRMIRVNNLLIPVWRAAAPVIFFGGKAAFLFLFACRIIVRKKKDLRTGCGLLIAAGLFLTALLLQFMVSWFCVFMGDRPAEQWWFYGGQAVPFFMTADSLMIGISFSVIKERLHGRFKTRKSENSLKQEQP